MRLSDKALVLQRIKHADSKYILKLFTREHGLISVSVRVKAKGPAGIRTTSTLALNFIEAELMLRPNRDIHLLTELRVYGNSFRKSQDIVRLSMAQFMQEVLIKALREQQANTALFDFLEMCFALLNESENPPLNLHLYFLAELGHFLGFEPQNNFNPSACYFDVREGQFSSVALVWPLGLNKEDSEFFSGFLKSNMLEGELKAAERRLIMDTFLHYYAFHLPSFGQLKSPDVLREILHS